ncbi:hypothetical protein HMPREF1032_03270 [Subdoligranulum sp. 4_3_54A2FAA]|nr:hypothetical protein HMPREF1032_03270 [Subdoligranulum sp. 4_3_54A2FAA]
MLKITLKNGKEYAALDSTAVYPSGNPNTRSRMEIHLPEDTMSVDTLAAIFADEEATSEIRMTRTVDEDNPEKGQKAGNVIYDTLYKQYCLVTSVGKKRITNTNFSSGQVSDAMHLVVELEQRTYIEQQLAALGL